MPAKKNPEAELRDIERRVKTAKRNLASLRRRGNVTPAERKRIGRTITDIDRRLMKLKVSRRRQLKAQKKVVRKARKGKKTRR